MIKVIGIGNRFMKDDGIAVMVLENIKNQLETIGIEVIVGETDFETCFHKINEDDFIIILDAVYKQDPSFCGEVYSHQMLETVIYLPADTSVGKIHINNLHQAIAVYGKPGYQHDSNIFDLISLYKKSLNGYLIGIEISEVGFGYGISEPMKKEFNSICLKVERIINKMI